MSNYLFLNKASDGLTHLRGGTKLASLKTQQTAHSFTQKGRAGHSDHQRQSKELFLSEKEQKERKNRNNMGNPTQEDLDNYHRLCVMFGEFVDAAQISMIFKQNDFDYEASARELEMLFEFAGADEAMAAPCDDFTDEDRSAYCDDKPFAEITPKMEHDSSLLPSLPLPEQVCIEWLTVGYCDNPYCKDLHTLYGVRCPAGVGCTDTKCPFVHTTVADQCLRAKTKLGIVLQPERESVAGSSTMTEQWMEAAKAMQRQARPMPEELRRACALVGCELPFDVASDFPEPIDDPQEAAELVQRVQKRTEAAGEGVEICSGVAGADHSAFVAPRKLWSSSVPFLDRYRARNNESVIHSRLRLYHLGQAVKAADKGDRAAAQQHLERARLHYERQAYLLVPQQWYGLLMANAHFGVFGETDERALFLYTLNVCEARDLLKKVFAPEARSKERPRRYFVLVPAAPIPGVVAGVTAQHVRVFLSTNNIAYEPLPSSPDLLVVDF